MTVRQRLLLVTAAIALAALAVVLVVSRPGRSSRAPRTFEVEMRASSGSAARLFWSADQHFDDRRSLRVPLHPATEGFERLRFLLPPDGIRWLRFDPTDARGDVFIGGMRLLDSNGQSLAAFDARSFRPANQTASITREGEVTKVTTTPAATNPVLMLAFGRLDRFSLWDDLRMVTPLSLALACVAVIALIGASVMAIGRAAFARTQRIEPSTDTRPSNWRAAVWLTALFLLAFSAKLTLIRDNRVTAPYWDQWEAQAISLFVPFSESRLSWPMMFGLQNEHRPFFTRLYALALLEVNAQWDPQLETVTNAVMHSFTAVLLASILWISNKRRRLDLLVFVCAAVFVLQFAWENTLLPFQSPFYFLLLFALLAVWLTTTCRIGTIPWCLGWLCAVCGLFSSGGGVMVPAAIGGVVALKLAGDPREWRKAVTNGAAAALVLALGAVVASPPLPGHEVLRAKTAAEFLGALGHTLAWPWIDRPRLLLVMWLPLGALLAAAALRRAKTTELERLAVGFGILVVLASGAMAYRRGANAALPATRYMDLLSLGFVVNAVALMTLLDRTRAGTLARYLASGMLASWLVFAIVGIDRLALRAAIELNSWRQFFVTQASNVRRFVIVGNVSEFVSKQPLLELPYPDPNVLAAVLQDPAIRRILPAAVRQPLHVEPRVITNKAFVMGGPSGSIPRDSLAASWWSLSDQGRQAMGRFESQPLACQVGGRLRFEVSGYLRSEHQYLALKELRTGRDWPVVPARLAGDGWTDASVPCPPGPFEIVAIDQAADSWFGFREPVEIGWASIVVESLVEHSRQAFVVLLVLTALMLGVDMPSISREP